MNVSLWVLTQVGKKKLKNLTQVGKKKLKNSLMGDTLFFA